MLAPIRFASGHKLRPGAAWQLHDTALRRRAHSRESRKSGGTCQIFPSSADRIMTCARSALGCHGKAVIMVTTKASSLRIARKFCGMRKTTLRTHVNAVSAS